MKNFFKVMTVVFLLSGSAVAQETAEVSSDSSQSAQAVDPNTPAPAAPYHIRIPHSERTKGNLLDSALDFMFVSFFKRYEDLEITYGFFEINAQRQLVFTDVKVKAERPDVKGTIEIKNITVGLSEFMAALKSNKVEVSEAVFKKISGNLTLGNAPKTGRHLKLTANEAMLKNITLGVWRSGASSEKFEDAMFGAASITGLVLNLTKPDEKYAVAFTEIKDLVLPKGKVDEFRFSSATIKGINYTDRDSFLKAIKK